MKLKYKRLFTLFLLIGNVNSYAQTFAVKAKLQEVPQTGFYKIPVTAVLSAYSNVDLSDIRILDNDGKTVPYLLRNDLYSRFESPFNEFSIQHKAEDTGRTVIELESTVAGFNQLLLEIANNSVGRYASLSGSADRVNWYIVSDNLLLSGDANSTDGSVLVPLSVPFSRYRYYRLVIRNNSNDPVNILRAGVITGDRKFIDEAWINNPGLTFQRRDTTGNRSVVTISQTLPFPVERLIVHASAPKFFARTVSIDNSDEAGRMQMISMSELRSGIDSVLEVPRTKANSLVLWIENGDNPPLQIDSIKLQYREKFLVVYLKQGNRYTIQSGNATLQAPNYDLQSFADSIPRELPLVQFSNLEQLSSGSDSTKSSNRIWIWAAIAGGLVLLCWLTFSLLRDVAKKQA